MDNRTPQTNYTVTQLAGYANVTADAVRYYVRLGLLKPVRNPCNGYRVFKKEDMKRLRFICQAKRLGYTLDDIAQIFADADKERSPCPRVREIIQRRMQENRQHLDELNALQTRMEDAVQQWSAMPDGMPDGHSICHLIESLHA